MTVVHKNYPNIPGIPGVSAEARMAEQTEPQRVDPAAQPQNASPTRKSSSLMPDKTRDVLRRIAEEMRRANGVKAASVEAVHSQ
jgi:hypothetical protein